jgi:hypothetical protein
LGAQAHRVEADYVNERVKLFARDGRQIAEFPLQEAALFMIETLGRLRTLRMVEERA